MKIYIVYGEVCDFEGYFKRNLKAYSNKAKAVEYAQNLNYEFNLLEQQRQDFYDSARKELGPYPTCPENWDVNSLELLDYQDKLKVFLQNQKELNTKYNPLNFRSKLDPEMNISEDITYGIEELELED